MKALVLKLVHDPSLFILQTMEVPFSPASVEAPCFSMPDGEGIFLGWHRNETDFKHVVRNARHLRDFLSSQIASLDSPDDRLAEVQKYAREPLLPLVGDIVTVAAFGDLQAVGKRQVVVLDHDKSVELAYVRDGVTYTQRAPWLALRPWVDPAAKVEAA